MNNYRELSKQWNWNSKFELLDHGENLKNWGAEHRYRSNFYANERRAYEYTENSSVYSRADPLGIPEGVIELPLSKFEGVNRDPLGFFRL